MNETSVDPIGTRLRQARRQAGLTQVVMAERMDALVGCPGSGWRQCQVTNTERGTRPIRLAEAVAWCKITEVSLEWLVGETRPDEEALITRALTAEHRLAAAQAALRDPR